MEKAGRRPLLLYPMIGMLVSFIVMMILLNLQRNPDLIVSWQLQWKFVCLLCEICVLSGSMVLCVHVCVGMCVCAAMDESARYNQSWIKTGLWVF